jgi:hypothetical protein
LICRPKEKPLTPFRRSLDLANDKIRENALHGYTGLLRVQEELVSLETLRAALHSITDAHS